ncbi:MAG: hypothetical protein QW385_03305 [Thermoproteota archaeon]
MSIENEDVKKRLESKVHGTIIVGIALTVLTGVLLYLLPIVCGMDASLLIILFLMFTVCLIPSYFLKVFRFLIVNIFLIWLSPLITILLNIVSPKYNIQPMSYLLAMEIVVYFLFIVWWIGSVAILRLFIGYEKLYKPIIYSYAVNDEINGRSLEGFKKLFRLLGARVVSVFRTKKIKIIEFIYKKDCYIACFYPKENQKTELDVIVFKLHHDTIIQPVRENVEVFFLFSRLLQ